MNAEHAITDILNVAWHLVCLHFVQTCQTPAKTGSKAELVLADQLETGKRSNSISNKLSPVSTCHGQTSARAAT